MHFYKNERTVYRGFWFPQLCWLAEPLPSTTANPRKWVASVGPLLSHLRKYHMNDLLCQNANLLFLKWCWFHLSLRECPIISSSVFWDWWFHLIWIYSLPSLWTTVLQIAAEPCLAEASLIYLGLQSLLSFCTQWTGFVNARALYSVGKWNWNLCSEYLFSLSLLSSLQG